MEIQKPKNEDLYRKYKIHLDDYNSIITKVSFDEIFIKYNLEKYKILFSRNLFGEKILEELNTKGRISLNKILLELFYLNSALSLIKIIKQYFDNITCVDFKENNFLFQIDNTKTEEEKSIGFLFGLIDDYKNNHNIGQFNLQYSPLEQIFNNMTMKDKENKYKVEIKINEEILDLFC